MFYSPLRYPGGKNKLSKFIEGICIDNSINGHYIEPYAGGAAVALYLLMEGRVREITLNDLDRSIYSFWWSVLNRADQLCELINEIDINLENWREVKRIQKNKDKAKLLDLGFSTLFLNRTNFSGIINAGPIGGLDQKSKYKIDCRFNKKTIINRIKNISKYKKKINLHNENAINIIKKVVSKIDKNHIVYLDPPYYLKGPKLYLNSYSDNDHRELAKEIKKLKEVNWIISYDNHKKIKDIYDWVDEGNKVDFGIQHSANKTKKEKEILFFSDTLSNLNLSSLTK